MTSPGASTASRGTEGPWTLVVRDSIVDVVKRHTHRHGRRGANNVTSTETLLPTQTITVSAARSVDATKVFGAGENAVTAIDCVSVAFEKGRFTAIMGPSGSGKSTLMHCMAGLDPLTSGHAFIDEIELNTLSEKELTSLRRDKVGFVFQS